MPGAVYTTVVATNRFPLLIEDQKVKNPKDASLCQFLGGPARTWYSQV